MNYTTGVTLKKTAVTITNHLSGIGSDAVKEEILEGLRSHPKYISSKFFYDKTGSELFKKITTLEEYYPTRTEKIILFSLGDGLNIDFRDLNIIELGSGDHSKIRLLLSHIPGPVLPTVHYYPVDISQSAILNATEKLLEEFPVLHIEGIVADFVHQLDLVPSVRKRLFCFFGSTIGNFGKNLTKRFLQHLGKLMKPGDHFLLGLDMVKDAEVLEKAYQDAQGVTAAFNKNILNVVNHLAGTDFDPALFEHVAFYDRENRKIEMHLRALRDMTVSAHPENNPISIARGEMIHTENSHKFNTRQIDEMATWAGLQTERIFTDRNKWFSLVHFRK